MNCLWILVLLFCCNGNNRGGDCGCERERQHCNHTENRAAHRHGERYPRAPFSPECDRDREWERDRECGCRASEMEEESCEE